MRDPMNLLLLLPLLAICIISFRSILRSSAEKKVLEQNRREAKYAERQKHQTLAHQLNTGNRTFNWLERELWWYRQQGLLLEKLEDNGGSFSIHIKATLVDGNIVHILQLDYDFLKYQAPYQGHIHYGAYDADILFWVDDHAPHNGLRRLVIREVKNCFSEFGTTS